MGMKQWNYVTDYRPYGISGDPTVDPVPLGGSFTPVLSALASAVDQTVNVSSLNHVAVVPKVVNSAPVITRVQGGSATQNEVQLLTFDWTADTASYCVITQFLAMNSGVGGSTGLMTVTPATPATTLQTLVQAMNTVSGANATVTGANGGPYTITFVGTLAHQALDLLRVNFYPGHLIKVSGAQGVTLVGANQGGWENLGVSVASNVSPGSQMQFITTAASMTLYFTGFIASGLYGFSSGAINVSGSYTGMPSRFLNRGPIVSVTVNGGTPILLDTNNLAPSLTLNFPGYNGSNVVASNTVLITHTGDWNPNISPFDAPVATVGTSVIPRLTLTPLKPATLSINTGAYKIIATSATTYTIQFAPQTTGVYGGATSFNTGTVYPSTQAGGIRGCGFTIAAGLTTSDTVVVNSSAMYMVIVGAAMGYQNTFQGNYMAYRSNVVDSGDPQTQWLLAEWTQNLPMYRFILETGQNATGTSPYLQSLVHDATYTRTIVSPTDVTGLIDFPETGVAGLVTAPRSRYCQWTIESPYTNYTTVPYFRDVSLYWWNPDTDSQLLGKLAFAQSWTPGPVMTALTGAMSVTLQETYNLAQLFTQGFQINTSTNEYLLAYGRDFSFPTYTGEPVEAYRAKLLGAFQSHQQGGCLQFIVTYILAMMSGLTTTPVVTTTVAANLSTVTGVLPLGTFNGLLASYTVILTQQGSNAYRLDINTSNVLNTAALPSTTTLNIAGRGMPALSVYSLTTGPLINSRTLNVASRALPLAGLAGVTQQNTILYWGFGYLSTTLARKIMTSYIVTYLNPAGSVIMLNNLKANINIFFDGVQGTF